MFIYYLPFSHVFWMKDGIFRYPNVNLGFQLNWSLSQCDNAFLMSGHAMGIDVIRRIAFSMPHYILKRSSRMQSRHILT